MKWWTGMVVAWAGLTGTAHAGPGVLQLTSERPVQVELDGNKIGTGETAEAITIDAVTPGRHVLVLRDGRGRSVHSSQIVMPDDSEMRCRLRLGAFECYDTVSLKEKRSTVRILVPVTKAQLSKYCECWVGHQSSVHDWGVETLNVMCVSADA